MDAGQKRFKATEESKEEDKKKMSKKEKKTLKKRKNRRWKSVQFYDFYSSY
jgi:hypothetical protein